MRNTVLMLGLIVIIALAFNSIPKNTSNIPKESIRVGALLCLTGTCAEWGQAAVNGMLMAADEINAQGGVLGKELEIFVQDSLEGESKSSVSAYRMLRSRHKTPYVVGPTWTPAGLAIAPIASKEKDVLVISPSLGVRDFNESADNLFNVWPHESTETALCLPTARPDFQPEPSLNFSNAVGGAINRQNDLWVRCVKKLISAREGRVSVRYMDF